MKMTVGNIPNSASLAQQSGLPLGCILRPLAPDENGEDNIDVVNFGSCGIVRCKRCRTYVNPFVQWLDNGRRWRCNLCGSSNEVPSSYFCHLDANGQRRDKDQRPELCTGSVELVAPAEYMVRPPQVRVHELSRAFTSFHELSRAVSLSLFLSLFLSFSLFLPSLSFSLSLFLSLSLSLELTN